MHEGLRLKYFPPLAAPALLLAAVLPSASALHVSAAPRSQSAVVAVTRQHDSCAYFNDVLGTVIALDLGSTSLDPTVGGTLVPGQSSADALALLQQLAGSAHQVT